MVDLKIKELLLKKFDENLYNKFPKKLRAKNFEIMKNHLSKRPNTVTAMAYVNGDIVGVASLIIDYKIDGYILGFLEDLRVIDEYQKMGIGTRLCLYLYKTAWSTGCNRVIGYVSEKNSIDIHLSQGVKVDKSRVLYIDNPMKSDSKKEWIKKEMPLLNNKFFI